MLVGIALQAGAVDTQVETLIYLATLLWIWVRPGLTSLSVMTVLWLNGIYWNVQDLNMNWGSAIGKALLVHLIMRLAVLLLAWSAYATSRRHAKISSPTYQD